MNPFATGTRIAQKRKERNLTQEQLAQLLGVSNKPISKWETGKCMPDYSVVQSLCGELELTITELVDGQQEQERSVPTYDQGQMPELLQRIQELELEKNRLYGILLLLMGLALMAVSRTFGGSALPDFFSGGLLGLSIGILLVGVFVIGRSFSKG